MEILQENSGAGCHFLLQRIFPTQGSNLRLLRLLQGQEHFYHQCHRGSPIHIYTFFQNILFHYGLSQDSEYGSLCYTVGPVVYPSYVH